MITPKGLLKNRHIQTLYAPLFRRQPTPEVTAQHFELGDGDFVECYWHERPPTTPKPIVILFHGLAGSFESPYIQGVMRTLAERGFASVLMHFRGCAGADNRLQRAYHSGDTADAKAWIDHLHYTYPLSHLYAVGYSIGGNMLLKLLGEEREQTPLRGAVSISAPLDLDISAKTITQGFAKFYQRHLLKPLKATLLRKYQQFDMGSVLQMKEEQVSQIKTIEEFDQCYTAPIHGFASASEYYRRCSAKPFLRHITIPTLIISALDDPFMTPEILPIAQETSLTITFDLSQYGGHVGFISGTLLRPHYWLEERIAEYLDGVEG